VAGSAQISSRGQGQRSPATLITDARSGASQEMSSRVRRYTYTMAFRTACFVAMIFVPGVFRWVLFGCAVFLPLIAVVLANQANRRSASRWAAAPIPTSASDAPQLTTGHESDEKTEVIDGEAPTSDVRGGRVA
jgi:type III secretory pathway component EscV